MKQKKRSPRRLRPRLPMGDDCGGDSRRSAADGDQSTENDCTVTGVVLVPLRYQPTL